MENDTLKLLRECDSGVQMGVSSIEDVISDIKDNTFRTILNDCKAEHERLRDELQNALDEYGDDGKAPNPMAKGMSWMKTNVMMAVKDSDATAADLMTDGCNMGVKSLSKYLNKYKGADARSKALTGRLIGLEEQLSVDIRPYL